MNEQYIPRPTNQANTGFLAALFALLLLLALVAAGLFTGVRFFIGRAQTERLRAVEAQQRAEAELIKAQQAAERAEAQAASAADSDEPASDVGKAHR